MPGPIKPKPFLIQPYPTLRKVAPYPFPKLGLPDCEHDLFDSIAQEHVGISGTEIDYFSHAVGKSTRDPLYDALADQARLRRAVPGEGLCRVAGHDA